MEGFDTIKNNLDFYLSKTNELMEKLTSDLSKDPSSKEIRQIVEEMDNMAREKHEIIKMDMATTIGVLCRSFIYQILHILR